MKLALADRWRQADTIVGDRRVHRMELQGVSAQAKRPAAGLPADLENGGSCLPSASALLGNAEDADGAPSWSCLCPPPWAGRTCTQQDATLAGDSASIESLTASPVDVDAPAAAAAAAVEQLESSHAPIEYAEAPPLHRRSVQVLPATGQSVLSHEVAMKRRVANPPAAASAPGADGGVVEPTTAAPGAEPPAAPAAPPAAASPATTSAPRKSVAEMTGVKQNSGNLLVELSSSFGSTAFLVLVCLAFFSVARTRLPLVYQGEATDLIKPPNTLCGWMSQAWNAKQEHITGKAGLDAGMLVTFQDFAARLLRTVGIPLIAVLVPLHWAFGKCESKDYASWLDIGNLEVESWVFWVHTGAVWYVVAMVMYQSDSAMRVFMDARHRWLKDMPYPRSLTVLAEEIPYDRQSEQELRRFFDVSVFGRPVVAKVSVVKDTREITAAEDMRSQVQSAIDRIDSFAKSGISPVNKALPMLQDQHKAAQIQIVQLRNKIKTSSEYNTPSAFIEFKNRRDKIIALKMFSEADMEDIILSQPPDPHDVRWPDLMLDPLLMKGKVLAGNLVVLGLFFAFIPLVVIVQTYARLEGLSEDNLLSAIPRDFPAIAAFWNGLVGSLALSILMGLVPQILILIFETFYKMVDRGQEQLLLQHWYFIFLVVFVLLVSAIGASLWQTAVSVVQAPTTVMSRLATTLPASSHFYLNYLAVQLGPEGLALVRGAQLVKFLSFRAIKGEKEAKEMAEPEDQTAQGIGGRSARFTILLIIPIMFCTICPLISFLAMLNFFLARMVYAYLLVYAETRKGDMGGEFWCLQLQHVQSALLLFIVTMSGVLFERGPHPVCGWIALLSIGMWWHLKQRWDRTYHWETLDFNAVCALEEEQEESLAQQLSKAFYGRQQASGEREYKQDELCSPRKKEESQWATMFGGGGGGDAGQEAS
eukprot:CAMPEP_0176138102 /NCGR_PEP_ID=MMETSP0120_2-20121206/70141_1 /TAXON_ID=160619 /ORGANISM="Kryptoperidinium foliaceum, Strain CCMP 1326" /LENGTH=929 /DNA_ID=CAMNT_0017474015 /DNA_START=1 /DNA_END=2789 /DNA_ORIENTATION=-